MDPKTDKDKITMEKSKFHSPNGHPKIVQFFENLETSTTFRSAFPLKCSTLCLLDLKDLQGLESAL